MGLLKLAEKYSSAKLEAACQKALGYSSRPSYKSIKNLLVTMKVDSIFEVAPEDKSNTHAITRGARYYASKISGGNNND